jgi:hypothetical protein
VSDSFTGVVLEASGDSRLLHIHSGFVPVTANGDILSHNGLPAAVIAALRGNRAITVSRARAWHLGRYRGLTVDVVLRPGDKARAEYLSLAETFAQVSLAVRPGVRARLYLARVNFPYGPDGLDFIAEAPLRAFSAWDRTVRHILATASLRGVTS